MGLDISYHARLEKAEAPVDGDGYDEGVFQPYINPSFPGRAEGLDPDAWYKCHEVGDFRAGSYSGYGLWRLKLAGIAEGDDFAELIHFSDCEGTIGPVVSAKLAQDFAKNRHRLEAEGWDEYDIHRYDNWAEAFRVASGGGCVRFH